MYLCHQILIMDLFTIVILVIIGLLAGLLSGVIGIGGGLIMIPLMMMIFRNRISLLHKEPNHLMAVKHSSNWNLGNLYFL